MDLKTTFRLISRAGSVGRAMLDGLGHRGELFLLDLAATRARFLAVLLFCALAGGFALLAGVAVTIAYAAAVWHRPDREFLLVVAALVYLALGGGCVVLAKRLLRDWTPLADTRAQLAEDSRCLNELLSSDEPSRRPSAK
jgi:uncharacterized membrane protein YqjE